MLWRVEGDFTAGKLTPTDFDFLHARLALSSMSRVMFATLNRGTCCGCNCLPEHYTCVCLFVFFIEGSFQCSSSSVLVGQVLISRRALKHN